jgi:hypothetical protein
MSLALFVTPSRREFPTPQIAVTTLESGGLFFLTVMHVAYAALYQATLDRRPATQYGVEY